MKLDKGRFWKAAVVLVGALLTGGLGLWWLRRPPTDTREVVRRLWAGRGVERPNVILITLDTTRADRLGCYGYAQASTPNIDALARGGVLFAQAASPAPLTLPAHSSIMTGMYPTHHGVRVNGSTALGQSQTTLAEVFSQKGYETGAFVGAFVLDGRWGLNQGFGVYDDHFDLKKYKHLDLAGVQRPADQVMDAALAWLESHKPDPFFAWIHLYDPHTPYEPPEPFRSRHGQRGLAGLYDGEIAFADEQVGRCVSWLRANALDEKTDRRRHGGPRRGAGQPRRGNPRLLRLRLRRARAVPRGHAVPRAARGPCRRAGQLRRRLPDRPRAQRRRLRRPGPRPVPAAGDARSPGARRQPTPTASR